MKFSKFENFKKQPDFEIKYKESLGFKVYENVFFIPGISALYDENGDIIIDSCLIRGEKWVVKNAEPVIDLNNFDYDCMDSAIYIGSFGYPHYGHFLTEQISRLWYLEDDNNIPVLFHNNAPKRKGVLFSNIFEIPQYQIDFLNALPKINLNRFLFTDKAKFIKKIIVPEPSFIIRSVMHVKHAELCRRVALHYMWKESYDKKNKIYLSRSLLNSKRRKVFGEKEVEIYLKDNGFIIFHPQNYNLEEQINLLNSSKVIIGTIGSSLHSLLFLLNTTKVFTLSNENINANFLMFDDLLALDNTYLNCLTEYVKSNENVTVDLSLACQLLNDRLILN
ncbi:glycosyltransferase family 61 protein [Vreelandella titanicae]|uniref:glycosyltransferase family 61 protein n=1 Tax=Vreelandella titanicae TaxID=664683 RepID=UPI003D2CDB3A